MHLKCRQRAVVLEHWIEGMLQLQLLPVVAQLVLGVPVEQKQEVFDLTYRLF